MAFVLRLWRRPTSGRKVLHLYWLQAPILGASPPQALGEQPLGMPVAFLKNRRSGYGEGREWERGECTEKMA